MSIYPVGEIRRRRPDYLAELAKTLAELAPPVGILLEEHGRCAHSWSRLPHSGLNRDWLVVPTIEASPTPHIEPVKTAQAPHEDQVRAWEILGEKLRRLGVRRVLLCGAYCSFHPAARQCVDGTSLALQVYCGFEDVRVLSGPTLMLGEPGSVTIVTITEEGAAC